MELVYPRSGGGEVGISITEAAAFVDIPWETLRDRLKARSSREANESKQLEYLSNVFDRDPAQYRDPAQAGIWSFYRVRLVGYEATQQQQYRNKTSYRGVWCLLRMVIMSTALLKWYVSSQVVLYTL